MEGESQQDLAAPSRLSEPACREQPSHGGLQHRAADARPPDLTVGRGKVTHRRVVQQLLSLGGLLEESGSVLGSLLSQILSQSRAQPLVEEIFVIQEASAAPAPQ